MSMRESANQNPIEYTVKVFASGADKTPDDSNVTSPTHNNDPFTKFQITASLPSPMADNVADALVQACSKHLSLNRTAAGLGALLIQNDVQKAAQVIVNDEARQLERVITTSRHDLLTQAHELVEGWKTRILQGGDAVEAFLAPTIGSDGVHDLRYYTDQLNQLVAEHLSWCGDVSILQEIQAFREERIIPLLRFALPHKERIAGSSVPSAILERLYRVAASLARAAGKSTVVNADECAAAAAWFTEQADAWRQSIDSETQRIENERLAKVKHWSKSLLALMPDKRLELSIDMGYTGENAFEKARIKLLNKWLAEVMARLTEAGAIRHVTATGVEGVVSKAYRRHGLMLSERDELDDGVYLSRDPQGVTLLVRSEFEAMLKARAAQLALVGMQVPTVIQITRRDNAMAEEIDSETIHYGDLLSPKAAFNSPMYSILLTGAGLTLEI